MAQYYQFTNTTPYKVEVLLMGPADDNTTKILDTSYIRAATDKDKDGVKAYVDIKRDTSRVVVNILPKLKTDGILGTMGILSLPAGKKGASETTPPLGTGPRFTLYAGQCEGASESDEFCTMYYITPFSPSMVSILAEATATSPDLAKLLGTTTLILVILQVVAFLAIVVGVYVTLTKVGKINGEISKLTDKLL